jgi:hypothetical protein
METISVQSKENGSQSIMELSCQFHLVYADAVERLAVESAVKRVEPVTTVFGGIL